MGKAAVKDSREEGHQLKEDWGGWGRRGRNSSAEAGNDRTGVSFVGNAEGRQRNWGCSRDGRTEKNQRPEDSAHKLKGYLSGKVRKLQL